MATPAEPFGAALPQNYYDVLGVRFGANEDEIRRAFRFKARQVHPDKNLEHPQAEEWMKDVNKAYEILSDRIRRTEYDEKLLSDDKTSHGVFEPLPDGFRMSQELIQMISEWMKVVRLPGLGQFTESFEKSLKELKQGTLRDSVCSNITSSVNVGAQKIVKSSCLDEISHALIGSTSNLLVGELTSCTLKRVLAHVRSKGHGQCHQEGKQVPVMNLSGATRNDLQFLLKLFTACDENSTKQLSHSEVVSQLTALIPKVCVQQIPTPTKSIHCTLCKTKFKVYSRHRNCFACGITVCASCPLSPRVLPCLGQASPQPVCSACCTWLDMQEAEAWVEAGLQYIDAATLESLRFAHACLTIALCSCQDSSEPILKFSAKLLSIGWPDIALHFANALMKTCSSSKVKVRAGMLVTTALKTLADQPDRKWKEKWIFTLAAKEACISALMLEESLEVPELSTKKASIDSSLHTLYEIGKNDHDRLVGQLVQQIEVAWERRDWKELLSIVTVEDDEEDILGLGDKAMQALEHFVAGKEKFAEVMIPEDRFPFLFLRGVVMLQNSRITDGLADIEKAAWGGHHSAWLPKEAVDIVITLLSSKFTLPLNTLYDEVEKLSVVTLLSTEEHGVLTQLLPTNEELVPPSKHHWPELIVTGIDMIATRKYEQGVHSQVQQGIWSEREAALAYIDLIPAYHHPAEVAMCFIAAGLWFLKELMIKVSKRRKSTSRSAQHTDKSRVQAESTTTQKSGTVKLAEVYAVKQAIMYCLQRAHVVSILTLHPGMQLYISRLALKTALSAVKLVGKLATPEDSRLVTQFLDLLVHSCRFCPFWKAPTVTVSEAVLLNIISGRLHTQFILGIQHIQPEISPIHKSELKYQLYENDICHVCPLDDSAGARERAMEELLSEKGWCWENVSQLMTSPLSPRTDEGWLVRQPMLGIPMEYASLKGFVINLDSDRPYIQILVQPASKSNAGLFSLADVAQVMQLNPGAAYFSLDQPSPKEQLHPFQEFRYGPDELQGTDFLQTMFETDYLLKSFSVGTEVSSKPPFKQRPCFESLTAKLPPHLSKAVRPMCERGPSRRSIHRFWIQATELVYDEKENTGNCLRIHIGAPKMAIRSHPLLPGLDGKLQDTPDGDDADSPEAQFAADLTKHYDELGHYFPMFSRLQELVKLQFMASVVQNVLDDLQKKARGEGIAVSDQMLQRIHQGKQEHIRSQCKQILREIRPKVGPWPSVDDEVKVSEAAHAAWSAYESECYRQYGYYPIRISDSPPLHVKSEVRDIFCQNDSEILSQVVDVLMKTCEQRVSREAMKKHVKDWLSNTCLSESHIHQLQIQPIIEPFGGFQPVTIRALPSSEDKLIDLMSTAFPLPTRQEVFQELLNHNNMVYDKLSLQVRHFKGNFQLPKPNIKACKWVPAALLQQHISENAFSLCYGGVILCPDTPQGSLPPLSSVCGVQAITLCSSNLSETRRVQQSHLNSKFEASRVSSFPLGESSRRITAKFEKLPKGSGKKQPSAKEVVANKLNPSEWKSSSTWINAQSRKHESRVRQPSISVG